MVTPLGAIGAFAWSRLERENLVPGRGVMGKRPGRGYFRHAAGVRITGIIAFVLLVWAHALAAQIPPPPKHYFNDYANLVKPETAARLETRLEAFERETSNQILVAILPSLPPGTDQFTYTVNVFRAWKPGQAGRDNGAILFVFVRDHQIWIQTGRGLEGALPDAVCKRITADEMAPAFKAGQYDAGIEAGVNAMIAATRGEYRGTGRTHAQAVARQTDSGFGGLVFFLVLLFIFFVLSRSRRRAAYRGPGGGFWIFPSGGGGGGGGGFSSGDDGGSGGGFSGGGGDTGGGGAGSKW